MHWLERRKAQRLIKNIREKEQEVVVDLGCGFRKQGNIGIDKTANGTDADLICNLGFESIPIADNQVDKVFCRDFLEHLPKQIYFERKKQIYYPIIFLINEVWRILKSGGIFESETPFYPRQEIFQDPTHVSVWTEESFSYFCGKYPISRLYGIKAVFEQIELTEKDIYLRAVLKKP